jgi:hypothetical protein
MLNEFCAEIERKYMMKKNLISLMLILFSSAMKGFNPYRKASMDLAHLKMSLFYLKGIKSSRLLVVGVLVMGVCLVLLASGLILFHATLFLFTPWSDQTKMIIGFIFAAIYLLIPSIVFSYVVDPEKWLKICQADNLINSLEKELAETPSADASKGYKNGNKHRETAEPYRR